MSAAAWSALADRFAALAAQQDFDLWLYPTSTHHLPSGVTNGAVRFMSATRLVHDRTGFEGLALTGSERVTGDEFPRFNRFRWLAWCAGRLLGVTTARPELEWLFAVHRENRLAGETSGVASQVRHVVAASATTARRLGEGGYGGRGIASEGREVLPAGGWQQPLLTLRDAFWQHANTNFDFHLELHGFTNPGVFGMGGAQVRQAREYGERVGRAVNTREGPELIFWIDAYSGGVIRHWPNTPAGHSPTSSFLRSACCPRAFAPSVRTGGPNRSWPGPSSCGWRIR